MSDDSSKPRRRARIWPMCLGLLLGAVAGELVSAPIVSQRHAKRLHPAPAGTISASYRGGKVQLRCRGACDKVVLYDWTVSRGDAAGAER